MSKKERLFKLTEKDFIFKPTRGTGKGGQKKNKTYSAIQVFHEPSGAMGYAEENRDQKQNKKLAFEKLTENPLFKAWLQMKIDACDGKIEITEVNDLGKEVTRKVRGDEV